MRIQKLCPWMIYGSIGGCAALTTTTTFRTTVTSRPSLGNLPNTFGSQQNKPSTRPWVPNASTALERRTKPSLLQAVPQSMMPLYPEQRDELSSLVVWITAFASSHIGMSAVRQTLITDVFGKWIADDVLGIVGTQKLTLPEAWPGDSSGTNELFPDVETTGRQLYRIVYTMVSFLTLGNAFAVYLSLRGDETTIGSTLDAAGEPSVLVSFVVATAASAFSQASVVNASPLGLIPSFRPKDNHHGGDETTTALATSDTLLGITRDDSMKFNPTGLTRITRHPLILPVVPWGIGTAVLAGGQAADFVLFGGLSLYAIAGCYCQDLRVVRNEGSVGTTFFVSQLNDQTATTNARITTELQPFYDQTSFLPFQACRQSWKLLFREFPTLAFLVALPSCFAIEIVFLRFLGVDYGLL